MIVFIIFIEYKKVLVKLIKLTEDILQNKIWIYAYSIIAKKDKKEIIVMLLNHKKPFLGSIYIFFYIFLANFLKQLCQNSINNLKKKITIYALIICP